MKLVSDSLVLMDFAVKLLDSVLYLPDREVKFLGENIWNISCIREG